MNEDPPPVREEFRSQLLLSDAAIAALGVRPADAELFRRMRYQNAFGVSTWYEALREHTFASEFVPMSPAASRALLDAHRGKPHDAELLAALAAVVEAAMRRLPDGGAAGAFVKLNTRSAKDVPLYDFGSAELRQRLDARLAEAARRGSGKSERELQNLEVAAFVAASQASVDSACTCLTLVRCSSGGAARGDGGGGGGAAAAIVAGGGRPGEAAAVCGGAAGGAGGGAGLARRGGGGSGGRVPGLCGRQSA